MEPTGFFGFNIEDLFTALSEIGIEGTNPFLDGEFQGGECRVFKVSFEIGLSVAIRMPKHSDGISQENVIAILRCEVLIHEKLNATKFGWAPRYRGASLTFSNAVQHPFLVLDWVEGRTLEWGDDIPAEPLRGQLLKKIALIQLSLITETTQNSSVSTERFFETRIERRLARVRESGFRGVSERNCLDQGALLGRILGPDKDSMVYAINHGDIKPNNIIVDDNDDIQCLIDWGFAALVPLVGSASLPCFLCPEHETSNSPVKNAIVLRDRLAYIKFFASQASQASLPMPSWQDPNIVTFRTVYLNSITSQGLHSFLARVGWKLPAHEVIDGEVFCGGESAPIDRQDIEKLVGK